MFWRKGPAPFDPSRYAEELLASLPKCTPNVAAIDSSLDDTFDAAFVLAPDQLLAWYERLLSKARPSTPKEVAASSAFRRWLASPTGDFSAPIACVPQVFFNLYSDYASDLVKDVRGVVYCPHCDLGYPDVKVSFAQTVDEGGGWRSGLELWLCARGHELRRAPYRYHTVQRRD